VNFKTFANKFGFKLLLCSIGFWFLLTQFEVGINVSESLPQKLFITIKNYPVAVNDYVEYRLTRDVLPYRTGDRFVKIVKGINGDRVLVRSGEVYVNEGRLGRVLSIRNPVDDVVLNKGELFVYSPHIRSLDSRYADHGLILESQVIGRAFPIF